MGLIGSKGRIAWWMVWEGHELGGNRPVAQHVRHDGLPASGGSALLPALPMVSSVSSFIIDPQIVLGRLDEALHA